MKKGRLLQRGRFSKNMTRRDLLAATGATAAMALLSRGPAPSHSRLHRTSATLNELSATLPIKRRAELATDSEDLSL